MTEQEHYEVDGLRFESFEKAADYIAENYPECFLGKDSFFEFCEIKIK